MARMESTRSRDAVLPPWRLERAPARSQHPPALLPDQSHRIKLSLHKYSIIRSAISPLFVIGRQFSESMFTVEKKNVKVFI